MAKVDALCIATVSLLHAPQCTGLFLLSAEVRISSWYLPLSHWAWFN